jgi:hypothetical protein
MPGRMPPLCRAYGEKRGVEGGGLSLTAPKRGKQRSLAATTGEQRTGGGGVGNGMEGPFYRRALEGKMDDGGCLHVGAHACARSRGPGAGEAGSGWRQREGDTELHGLSLAPVQEGEVA